MCQGINGPQSRYCGFVSRQGFWVWKGTIALTAREVKNPAFFHLSFALNFPPSEMFNIKHNFQTFFNGLSWIVKVKSVSKVLTFEKIFDFKSSSSSIKFCVQKKWKKCRWPQCRLRFLQDFYRFGYDNATCKIFEELWACSISDIPKMFFLMLWSIYLTFVRKSYWRCLSRAINSDRL